MAAALERLIGGHQPKGVGPYEAFLGAPRCHPRFVGAAAATRKRRGQCVTDAELAQAVRSRPSRTIPSSGRDTNLPAYRRSTLRRDLAARTKCKETDERCILEAAGTIAAKELLAQALRPAKPAEWDSDPDQWLNNENIEQVLKQYADIYPWFRFFGVHPIDFSAPSPYVKGQTQCLIPKMCSIEIPKLRAEGVKYGGIVLNLDNHLGKGSHWVGIVIDTKEGKSGVYYFDSYGMKPPIQVRRFMEDLAYEEPKAIFGYNGRRFQFGNSECGIYSMLFIICMIHGVPFSKFVKRPMADKYMLALRDWLFS
jgi:hypothetical protein